jgi:hypothetical protein
VKSTTTEGFWKRYKELPADIKRQAKEMFRLFQHDPYYPSLHFKRIHSTKPVFSARVSRTYRAVGIMEDVEIIWFWIGPHSEYDRLVKSMRGW